MTNPCAGLSGGADEPTRSAKSVSPLASWLGVTAPSVGVRYLVVGGTLLVDQGQLAPDVFPGRALSAHSSQDAK